MQQRGPEPHRDQSCIDRTSAQTSSREQKAAEEQEHPRHDPTRHDEESEEVAIHSRAELDALLSRPGQGDAGGCVLLFTSDE